MTLPNSNAGGSLAAAEIAGMRVDVDGEYWQAEAQSNVKVGF